MPCTIVVFDFLFLFWYSWHHKLKWHTTKVQLSHGNSPARYNVQIWREGKNKNVILNLKGFIIQLKLPWPARYTNLSATTWDWGDNAHHTNQLWWREALRTWINSFKIWHGEVTPALNWYPWWLFGSGTIQGLASSSRTTGDPNIFPELQPMRSQDWSRSKQLKRWALQLLLTRWLTSSGSPQSWLSAWFSPR